MDRSRPSSSQRTAFLQDRPIPPSQVWSQLTQDQQQHTLRIMVLVCRELTSKSEPVNESEVSCE